MESNNFHFSTLVAALIMSLACISLRAETTGDGASRRDPCGHASARIGGGGASETILISSSAGPNPLIASVLGGDLEGNLDSELLHDLSSSLFGGHSGEEIRRKIGGKPSGLVVHVQNPNASSNEIELGQSLAAQIAELTGYLIEGDVRITWEDGSLSAALGGSWDLVGKAVVVFSVRKPGVAERLERLKVELNQLGASQVQFVFMDDSQI